MLLGASLGRGDSLMSTLSLYHLSAVHDPPVASFAALGSERFYFVGFPFFSGFLTIESITALVS